MFDSAGEAPGEDLYVLGPAREFAALPAQPDRSPSRAPAALSFKATSATLFIRAT